MIMKYEVAMNTVQSDMSDKVTDIFVLTVMKLRYSCLPGT